MKTKHIEKNNYKFQQSNCCPKIAINRCCHSELVSESHSRIIITILVFLAVFFLFAINSCDSFNSNTDFLTKINNAIKAQNAGNGDPSVPIPSDPTPQEPTQQDPTASDPTQQDPTASDPTQQDPTASDPTQADPTPQDPTSDPEPSDPTSDPEPTVDTTPTENFVFVPSIINIKSFYISDHEVTQQEFNAVMKYNPSSYIDNPAEGETQELRPVENVSWYEAIVYCNKLSIAEDLTPCYSLNDETNPEEWGTIPTTNSSEWIGIEYNENANGYRLPKLDEWGNAAAGTLQDSDPLYTAYAGSNTINEVAWNYDNSIPDGRYTPITHQVKTLAPNTLNIYDMNGNVAEWCWDLDSRDIHVRAIAGGSCMETGIECSVIASEWQSAHVRYETTGFRVARTVL